MDGVEPLRFAGWLFTFVQTFGDSKSPVHGLKEQGRLAMRRPFLTEHFTICSRADSPHLEPSRIPSTPPSCWLIRTWLQAYIPFGSSPLIRRIAQTFCTKE